MERKPYSAGAVKFSFWFMEFRKTVQLLSEGKSFADIKKLNEETNIYGAPTKLRAQQIYSTVTARIKTLDESFYPIFLSSDLATQKLFVLTAALLHDTLFFDFVYEVVREKMILGSDELTDADIRIFFKNKQEQSEKVASLQDYTLHRLGSCYKTQLYEAGLLESNQANSTRKILKPILTYTGRYVQAELPAAWRSFVSYKSGNIIAFLDSLMNSVLYRDKYDALSAHVAKGLNVFSAFAGMRVDDLVECDTFLAVDQVLVKWLISRLVSEDIGAIVNGFTIPELCEKRAKMHFGRKTGKTYQLLSSAYSMVKEADYHAVDGLKPIIDRYLAADYNMDQQYRKFYYYYDQLESTESFEPLRELVENIYTNEYLACLLPAWNAGIQQDAAFSAIPLQREFYNANLRYTKERTVVIISDAMRYEVGQELFARMQDDPKCTAKLSVQLSVLPSYTRLGMAALLPHKTLEMTDDFQVLADGILCDNLAGRQQVLQSYNPDSVCVQFDDIKNLEVSADKLGLPEVGIIDVLNVKSDPLLIGSLRGQDGYFPAYHMNKEKWLSIQLGKPELDDAIKDLLSLSHELIAPKKRNRKLPANNPGDSANGKEKETDKG